MLYGQEYFVNTRLNEVRMTVNSTLPISRYEFALHMRSAGPGPSPLTPAASPARTLHAGADLKVELLSTLLRSIFSLTSAERVAHHSFTYLHSTYDLCGFSFTMSSRNRGRGNNSQDADEERRLWKEIKDKAAEVDNMVVSNLIFVRV